jgi:hypothetical protein
VNHFEFQTIPADRWRRLAGTTPVGSRNDRPHFVPITDEGRTFAAMDSFIGGTGLCPGEILVDGEWVTGFRFIRIPDDVAAEMLVDLNEAVENFLPVA